MPLPRQPMPHEDTPDGSDAQTRGKACFIHESRAAPTVLVAQSGSSVAAKQTWTRVLRSFEESNFELGVSKHLCAYWDLSMPQDKACSARPRFAILNKESRDLEGASCGGRATSNHVVDHGDSSCPTRVLPVKSCFHFGTLTQSAAAYAAALEEELFSVEVRIQRELPPSSTAVRDSPMWIPPQLRVHPPTQLHRASCRP
ncbi:hypothetical protein RB195_002945 [Necator americanus]|uniref:Uncharacterized protein n=1 Tax=Necator americanus TaxID=51031 RepID=A0ABR1DP71_NECAM